MITGTPRQIYYSVEKPNRDFFKWCESHFYNYTWKYRGELHKSAPNYQHREHKEVAIRKMESIRRYNYTKASEKTFLYRTVFEGKLVSQLWKFRQVFSEFTETLDCWLINLEIYSTEYQTVSKYEPESKIREGLTLAYGNGYGLNDSTYGNYSVYHTNWIDDLKLTEFKYLPTSIFTMLMRPEDLLRRFKYRAEIEYAINIKANGLIDQMVHTPRYIDMRTVNLRWLRSNKQRLRNSNLEFGEVNTLIRLEKLGKVVPGIIDIVKSNQVKYIPKEVGFVKWQNWAIKNNICMITYIDYLSMLGDLGVEDKSTGTLIPSSLAKSHDKAAKQLNSLKKARQIEIDRLKNEEYQSNIQSRKNFNFTGNDYVVILPNKLSDIVGEGAVLKHCVGGSHYLDRHLAGKTTILFVRTVDAPDVSLYTLEFRDWKIVQLRGKFNESAPKEVTDFIENTWIPEIIKKFRNEKKPQNRGAQNCNINESRKTNSQLLLGGS